MNIQKITFSLLFLVLIVVVLIYGQSLILPFVLALLIWFVIKELREIFQKIPWVQKHVKRDMLSGLAFLIIVGCLGLVSKMLSANIAGLSKSLPVYQEKITRVSMQLQEQLGLNFKTDLAEYASSIDFAGILELVINSLSDLIGNAVLILIYLVFILLEEGIFGKKLKAIYPDVAKREKMQGLLAKIDRSIGKYIALKTCVSLITGVLSYLALLIFGVDAPLFWAILIFILNYIPTVGSLIGTLFPAVFALLQFSSIETMFYVLASVGIIQVLVGNVLEPRLMGNSLNVSALVVIVSLSFWGAIWGIVGMILSVPITVTILIICATLPQTQKVALLFSEKGEI